MSRFNDGPRIPTIISRTDCRTHQVPVGVPCFSVDFDTVDGYGSGVCGKRVSRAGYVGEITAFSMRQKSTGGRSDGRRNK